MHPILDALDEGTGSELLAKFSAIAQLISYIKITTYFLAINRFYRSQISVTATGRVINH